MIAEHLFMLHFLGLRDAETDRKLANELLARRRDDGTWAIWWDGPADLSVTVEAYVALKLAGVDAGEATRAYIRREGGIAQTRIFTKAFLALLGQWPWHRMVNVPVELILAPPGAPLSVYDFACWARQTLVPLSVVMALKPVRPAGIDLSEIGARPGRNRRPLVNPVRRRAIRVAERWVRERQEADGSWGGIQPPWVWSLLMLAALGHGREDECFRRGIDGWAGFLIDEGDRLRPEACQSPVWDTALAVLGAAGRGRARRPSAARQGRSVAARARRSRSAATGRCAAPSSRPAAGPSSSRTTSTRTSTTRPWSRSRCASSGSARTPCAAGSTGRRGCSRRTAAGAPSTPTTRSTGSRGSRSATSAP